MAEKFRYNPPFERMYDLIVVTQPFGWVNNHFHDGVDFAPRHGHDNLLRYPSVSQIYEEGWHPVSGWYVKFYAQFIDNREFDWRYNHMAHRSPHRAKNGFRRWTETIVDGRKISGWAFGTVGRKDKVDVGQWAGTIGSTGYSTGTHCHLMTIDDKGIKRDPELICENWRLVEEAKERGY